MPSLADPEAAGARLFELVAELFPLHRSITGEGVRDTLARLTRHIPLVIHEVPSGTRVFDWTVPDEWNVRDAWIADASGRRVVDNGAVPGLDLNRLRHDAARVVAKLAA